MKEKYYKSYFLTLPLQTHLAYVVMLQLLLSADGITVSLPLVLSLQPKLIFSSTQVRDETAKQWQQDNAGIPTVGCYVAFDLKPKVL